MLNKWYRVFSPEIMKSNFLEENGNWNKQEEYRLRNGKNRWEEGWNTNGLGIFV